MGITIQAYRCSIGRFLPKHSSIDFKNHSAKKYDENPSKSFSIRNYLLLIIVLCIPLCYVFFGNSQFQNMSKTNNHPLYPSTSLQNITTSRDNFTGNTTTDIAATFILQYGIHVMASFSSRMITNFSLRYLNGNRKSGGIKISHWNKGPGFLQNKMPEVKNILNGLHPHILGLSEANLKRNHDQNLIQLDDYVLHTCPTINNPEFNTSRVVVYTHNSLVVKLRPDLMCDSYSSIWMEVGLPRHKKFLVGQTYREWQLPGQADRSSLAVAEQLARWTVFLDQWERALDTGMEVHLLGDMNLNHLNWTDLTLPASNQTSKLRTLITALFTRMLPHCVSQCVCSWSYQTLSRAGFQWT